MNVHDCIDVKDILHFTVHQKANLLTLIKFHGFSPINYLELMLSSELHMVDYGYLVFTPYNKALWKIKPSTNKISIEELMQMMEIVNFE